MILLLYISVIYTVAHLGAWSKRVVPILLMSNGCFFGRNYNKPIRVSSSIPFKSELRSCHGGFAIYTAEFVRAKTERVSREETDLLMHKPNYDTCNDYPSVIIIILL